MRTLDHAHHTTHLTEKSTLSFIEKLPIQPLHNKSEQANVFVFTFQTIAQENLFKSSARKSERALTISSLDLKREKYLCKADNLTYI